MKNREPYTKLDALRDAKNALRKLRASGTATAEEIATAEGKVICAQDVVSCDMGYNN
jgi:hypothetical protein